ncbi:hypothetical protein Taro_039872 [Colocasia esculenta]|uniref:Peroxisomal membrane protein PEX16 n=1 Tax=Colocasia esculenta TaxID=4460 RepID=A0A843WNH6_COLES|nr:hypothetical protein [Colocasia esculenta]
MVGTVQMVGMALMVGTMFMAGMALMAGTGSFPTLYKSRGGQGKGRIFGVPNIEQSSEKDCKAVWEKGLQDSPKEHCARHNFDFLKSQASFEPAAAASLGFEESRRDGDLEGPGFQHSSRPAWSRTPGRLGSSFAKERVARFGGQARRPVAYGGGPGGSSRDRPRLPSLPFTERGGTSALSRHRLFGSSFRLRLRKPGIRWRKYRIRGGDMETYKKWVRKNKEFVHSLESLANGITWLLPERFSNSEMGPEAVYAILGIFSTVNQHIIDTTPSQVRSSGLAEFSFPWSLCVSVLKDLETVVEVAAQQLYGDDGKWNFIAVTEAAKVLVRLALFSDSGYKMLLQGGEELNTEKASKVSDSRGYGMPTGYAGPTGFQDIRGYDLQNLEGRALSALSTFGQNARMTSELMWSKVQRTPSFAPASLTKKPTLSTFLSEKGLFGSLFVTGEVLCIIRPLIYVLFIRKCGIQSWTPWLISLVVDLTGVGILSCVTRPSVTGGRQLFPLSVSEKNEVKRRKILWALYVLRDPFFGKYARHRLENSERYLQQVPFIGFLTAKLVELLIGAQTRYTYTSGS